MTVPNNHSSVLIAYGSHAPGGANHHVYASLPGKWRKGFINQICHEAPDDIGPEEGHLIEAWLLELPGKNVEMYTPEYEARKRTLHDIWTGLDAAIGPEWGRTGMRWWPEGSEPLAGANGMLVANIHVPLDRFAYLADPDDVPHPDDADDIVKLWQQVKRGEKEYDWSHFLALIKDAQPAEFDHLFGDLPNSGEFLSRLKQLFADHLLSEASVLTDGEERFYWYVCPLQRNALPMSALVELAKQDIAQRVAFLRRRDLDAEADVLARLRFEPGNPDDPAYEPAAAAMDRFDDELRHTDQDRPHWMYCLKEACYGIAASFVLRDWLMLAMNVEFLRPARAPQGILGTLGLRKGEPAFDLEPAYRLWKAGGKYVLDGATCFVHEVDRRQA
ncbi:hypothetical protein NU688_07685 [Variovorax sp. ZS18.2.2]|uniref:hypothetical protein n=1 Tax=Variovorax sp. ZS18.2.2 TaxID=2971255 RepID=UPI0021508027|nr:hypothetical protein [Variovorax sp. ZS18.2.2]MCR6476032.1 hypothetical protein [Variovorax sp. ZS18.2.2]